MKCEKCGKEIDRIMVNRFNHDGSDSLYNYSFCEVEQNAVCIDTDRNWVGYELTEEERIETIQCPHCGEAQGLNVNKRWNRFCPGCGQAIDWSVEE